MSTGAVSERRLPQGLRDELQFRSQVSHVLFGLAFLLCFLYEINVAYGAYRSYTPPHLGIYAIIIACNVAPLYFYLKGWRWFAYGSLPVPLVGTVWFAWCLFCRAVDSM